MIKVTHVVKRFQDKEVLSDVNFTLEENGIYGLIGANGVGKSTLLRLINGIYAPDEGTITFGKEAIFDCPKAKEKMFFIPDEVYFYPNYTLYDMALFYNAIYPSFNLSKLKEMADELKLSMEEKIEHLSKGQKRQCSLILALASRCAYYFFDETFDGIDPVIRKAIKKWMIDLMVEEKTTFLIASHNLRELEDLCDHLAILYNGKILFEKETDDLKRQLFKVQLHFKKDLEKEDFASLDLLSYQKMGSIITLILRGEEKEVRKQLEKMKPDLLDFIPLTLEEIFIYEMEALGYGVVE